MRKYFPLFLIIFILFPAPGFAYELTVPFIPQTAGKGWVEPWKSACEETSITIIDHYYSGQKLDNKIGRNEILRLVKKENEILKKNKDTDLEETARMINLFYPWEAHIVENPTLEDVKAELEAGRPVIVPVYGPDLKNRYYAKTIDAHMFVVSGFDDENREFIVQEVGMKKGRNFRYGYDLLLNAVHEYVPGRKTKSGRRAVIFTAKDARDSRNSDGDKDGLKKADEISAGTSLWLADTDGDKYSDGTELAYGYSPLVNESKLNKVFIRTDFDPTVYYLQNKKKKAGVSVGKAKVITVSEEFMNQLSEDN